MKKYNNIKFLLTLANLEGVRRYAGLPMNKRDSVADHRSMLFILVSIITEDLAIAGNLIDWHKLFQYVAVHDTEEAITGDIIFNFSSPEIKAMKKEYGSSFLNNNNKMHEYFIKFEEADDYESKIVKHCDMLEVVVRMYKELTLGNSNVIAIIERAISYCKDGTMYCNSSLYKEIIDDFSKLMIGYKHDKSTLSVLIL